MKSIIDHVIIGLAWAFTIIVPGIMGIGFVIGVDNVDGGIGFFNEFRDTVIILFWGGWVCDLVMASVSVLFLSGVLLGSVSGLFVSPEILYTVMGYVAYLPLLILLFWVFVFVNMLVRWKNES